MQHEPQSLLPMPDAVSAAHSARVVAYIFECMKKPGGSISFAEFMQHALYAPGLGYYAAGAAKLGAAGDFVTAPEISSLFGRILARQCAEVFAELNGGSILEFGAGSGKLAADVLRMLAELEALPDEYAIVEVSADLRQRQEQFLKREVPEYFGRCRWVEALPLKHTGVVIANEVLDALPVERFVRRETGLQQIRVSFDKDTLVCIERPAPEVLRNAVASVEADLGQELPLNYVSEVSLATAGWIGDVAGLLQRGVVFLADYGVSRREYYAADRSAGWLRCHFRHQAHSSPLIHVGIQDLTAWVDFSAVAAAAVASGLEITGYVAQAQFLLSGGLEKELENFTSLPLEKQVELSGQVKLLTLPGEMGENFKLLGLCRGMEMTPSAFNIADRTMTL